MCVCVWVLCSGEKRSRTGGLGGSWIGFGQRMMSLSAIIAMETSCSSARGSFHGDRRHTDQPNPNRGLSGAGEWGVGRGGGRR